MLLWVGTSEYMLLWVGTSECMLLWVGNAAEKKREGKISLALEIMSPKRKETQRKTGQEKNKEGKIRKNK